MLHPSMAEKSQDQSTVQAKIEQSVAEIDGKRHHTAI
jgi:hypothetical protein